MTNESMANTETPTNSFEVFTDDAKIAGPDDSIESLRAFTVGCGVLTLDNRSRGIVGLIHISEGPNAESVLDFAQAQAKGADIQLSEFKIRRFKGSETIWSNVQDSLRPLGITLPEWETTIEPGIAIEKETGEISFYT